MQPCVLAGMTSKSARDMKGQDNPGTPGLSWSAFGRQRSPAAWGGAAAQLQTPQSTVREAMVADEAQVPFLPLRGHCNCLARLWKIQSSSPEHYCIWHTET